MGALMIKCPNTGRDIFTGMNVDKASFGSSPVFFGETFCPICRTDHQWFATDAWVCDGGPAAAVQGPALQKPVPAAEIRVPLPPAWAIEAQGRRRGSR
jgi:hypothetical protein